MVGTGEPDNGPRAAKRRCHNRQRMIEPIHRNPEGVQTEGTLGLQQSESDTPEQEDKLLSEAPEQEGKLLPSVD